MTGSPSWKNYVEFAEKSWREAGVVDIFRNSFTFTRWSTTEYPDDSNWSLHVDGKKIKVASYGCNSGQTPAEGVTGELVVYKEGMPAGALRGKIAIVVKEQGRGGSSRQRRLRIPVQSRDFSEPAEPTFGRSRTEPVPDHGTGRGAEAADRGRRGGRGDRDAALL